MTAICPAGPPNESEATLAQSLVASPSGTEGGAFTAREYVST